MNSQEERKSKNVKEKTLDERVCVNVVTALSVQPNTGKYTLARFSRNRREIYDIEKIVLETNRRTDEHHIIQTRKELRKRTNEKKNRQGDEEK
jgi:hypothetical protein